MTKGILTIEQFLTRRMSIPQIRDTIEANSEIDDSRIGADAAVQRAIVEGDSRLSALNSALKIPCQLEELR
jgi:hypothetical protein